MEKQLLAGALLVAGAMASIGAVAGYVAASRPLYAEVVTVEPVTRLMSVQRQECRDSKALRGKSLKEPHRPSGTVIGGMVGGVIGLRPGEGSGRAIAAAAGAPDSEPNRVQKAEQEDNHEARCRIVNRTEQQVYAYDVRYRFDGKLGSVRTAHAPGPRIPVRDGKLVLQIRDEGKP